MKKRKEVKTIQVDYVCPKCDYGKLRPTGMVSINLPSLHSHKCTECDYTQSFECTYPYVEYETINL